MSSAPIEYNWISANTTYIAAVQSLGGAGSMVLNGSNVGPFQIPGMIRAVSLTSLNNNSAVNFTITGTVNGRTLSQTIAGPNANTVETTTVFDVITSITTNGAINAVSAGIGHTGFTPWFTCDYNRGVFNLSCAVDVTNNAGAITYSFVGTLDDVASIVPYVFNATSLPAMVGLNVDGFTNATIPLRFASIFISASTADASLRATFLQQGIK
jgi:hypothetical protein